MFITEYDEAATMEKFKKEFITSKIDQIINKRLNTLKRTTPSDDAEILRNVKHNIIKIEETLKSYYLDVAEDKVNNEDLNLETYYKISNVLKDTIFNLVRLEEYN